jgi:glutamyl-tRNA reductase
VLLIGAGTTGEVAGKHLFKHHPRELLVLGRGSVRAEQLAERYGGRAVTCDQLGGALARSDVVISSSSAPHAIVDRHQLERALAARGDAGFGPLVLIDLATPRDIDPAAAGLAGVEVYTIDDLRPIVERTLSQHSAKLPSAYSVVRAEVARFTDWLRRRETAADLHSLSIGIELARVGGEAGIRLPVRAQACRSCQ